MDLTDPVSIKEAFAKLEEAGERIDICINNAAIGGLTPVFSEDNKDDFSDFWQNKIPLGFIAEPSDLDGLVLYLASNKASHYVRGATFTIDGGISCGGKF